MADRDKNQEVEERLVDLASDTQMLYEPAYTWFVEQGPDITRALVQGLDDEYLGSVGYGRILRLLGHFAQEETLPAILKALRMGLNRHDSIVLFAAMDALATFHTPDATDALVALLQEHDPDIVKHAALLLGQTGDSSAVGPLVRLLAAESPSIRYSAVQGLVQLDDPAVRTVLQHHRQRETDPEVRELIESALAGQ
ncbi:MAG: HEAT repeat domain-containing protein [Ardenticatenaceae bacterium]|nr:HEAT repeat domain-containing protein [Ardenticatenaceae bacterium]